MDNLTLVFHHSLCGQTFDVQSHRNDHERNCKECLKTRLDMVETAAKRIVGVVFGESHGNWTDADTLDAIRHTARELRDVL